MKVFQWFFCVLWDHLWDVIRQDDDHHDGDHDDHHHGDHDDDHDDGHDDDDAEDPPDAEEGHDPVELPQVGRKVDQVELGARVGPAEEAHHEAGPVDELERGLEKRQKWTQIIFARIFLL